MQLPHVVIVGAGFGGLAAARVLRKERVSVTVVDRHNYHTFLPLLYQVATAGLEPQDIAHPVRSILSRQRNARFRLGEVVGGNLSERMIELASGEKLHYDFLILACGSKTETFGLAGAEEHAFGLHSLDEARAFRNGMLRALERADWERDPVERGRLLTFVVVGGGPTGVEIAGALAELRKHVVPRDYAGIDPKEMRVILLEGADALLRGMPEALRAKALRSARELEIDVRLNALVERIREDRVLLADGSELPTRSVLWAAGVRGASVGEKLGLSRGRSARISVAHTLQVPGHPHVFAIGDLALVEEAEGIPQMAPVAKQQGRSAARNILRLLADQAPQPFRHRKTGQLATIGRSRAVAEILGLRFSGHLAWWVWLTAHLLFLVGFRNRAVVLVNWTYSYFTYDRGVRSIVGSDAPHRDRS